MIGLRRAHKSRHPRPLPSSIISSRLSPLHPPTDLSTADVISMYLSVRGNTEMLPSIIAAAAAGRSHRAGPLRVVTFSFEIPGHAPISKAIVDGIPIYLYAFPRAT